MVSSITAKLCGCFKWTIAENFCNCPISSPPSWGWKDLSHICNQHVGKQPLTSKLGVAHPSNIKSDIFHLVYSGVHTKQCWSFRLCTCSKRITSLFYIEVHRRQAPPVILCLIQVNELDVGYLSSQIKNSSCWNMRKLWDSDTVLSPWQVIYKTDWWLWNLLFNFNL